MFDKDLLEAEMHLHHLSAKQLAQMLDTTEATISRKLNGIAEWKLTEIQVLSGIFGSDKIVAIFFAK